MIKNDLPELRKEFIKNIEEEIIMKKVFLTTVYLVAALAIVVGLI